VSSFDVTGLGSQNAGTFNVGEVSHTDVFEGGGVWQNFTSGGGLSTLSYDWAVLGASHDDNYGGGRFSLVLDGVTLASYNSGYIVKGTIHRGSFSVDTTLTPGTHQFEILIERAARNDPGYTPTQYVTNAFVTASSSSTPEPSTLLLFGSGLLGLGRVVRRRRS
jgi:hypothetical protein